MIIYYIFKDKNDYLHMYNRALAVQNIKPPFHRAILRALHRTLRSRAIFLVFESTVTFHTRNS